MNQSGTTRDYKRMNQATAEATQGKDSSADTSMKVMVYVLFLLTLVDIIVSIAAAAANNTNKMGYKGLGFSAILSCFIICGLCYQIFKMVLKKQPVTQLVMGFLIGSSAMFAQLSFFLCCVFFTFATESKLNGYGTDPADNAFGAFSFFNFIYFTVFTYILWSRRLSFSEDEPYVSGPYTNAQDDTYSHAVRGANYTKSSQYDETHEPA